ncbi:hypothetical protein HY732_00735 [Candidatus Uhrbacteria bacterium]|nr:hypothetical protein [Candidatus Uhrbacteria bacterium]
MSISRIENIQQVLESFTGTDGEPANELEKYLLNSMWVMLCAEFEGAVKDKVEEYIDLTKRNKAVKDMHICFLLQNFYGSNPDKEKFTIGEILGVYEKDKSGIDYSNFTRNKKARNKSFSIKNHFNSLGIFFIIHENTALKLLDGISSTRDSIVHGDHEISTTRKQLEENISTIKDIFKMLEAKLK